jgi:hypothetical protein
MTEARLDQKVQSKCIANGGETRAPKYFCKALFHHGKNDGKKELQFTAERGNRKLKVCQHAPNRPAQNLLTF